ncbi:MAG: hypothetical protein M3R65_03065 [Gemmatimonadota bacterium]|nr:hypothetical protein [Gemmatimonadota bacterium]
MPARDTSAPTASSSSNNASSAANNAITNAAGGAMGKDQFVHLLVTQMQNQDPLNPMDGKDLAAQLAQFSSVEQLINANTTLSNIAALLTPPSIPGAPTPSSTGASTGTSTGTPTGANTPAA